MSKRNQSVIKEEGFEYYNGVIKKEKSKHILAFQYYRLLGGFGSKRSIKETTKKLNISRGTNFYRYFASLCGRRSLLQVARKFNISRTTVNNWYKSFNWEDRAREWDAEINRKVEKRLQSLQLSKFRRCKK